MSLRRYLPISYDVAGKSVAIVGGGPLALAKLRLAAGTSALLTLFAPSPGRIDLAAAARAAGAAWVGRYPDPSDLAGTALLFIATGDEDLDQRLATAGRALGIPVNVVDRPDLSTFAMPALVERGPLSVAIASDGAAPVLAQRVRGLIDAILPATFADLAELAREIRPAVLARFPSSAARRRFWWRLVDGDAGRAALAGRLDRARALALGALAEAATERPRGKVFVIPVPEDVDLLTMRGQRLLLGADVVVHDIGVAAELLALGRREADRIPVDGTDAVPLLVRLAREGRQVARLTRHRRAEELHRLDQAGIDHELVPGVAAPSPASHAVAA
jgi:uroporphyrin-III C-methyltransferase / precorrin-2 dehydrogenase / sirohydrochlorin ferrochelatase